MVISLAQELVSISYAAAKCACVNEIEGIREVGPFRFSVIDFDLQVEREPDTSN